MKTCEAWQRPKLLQKLASQTIVETFMSKNEKILKNYNFRSRPETFYVFQQFIIPGIIAWKKTFPNVSLRNSMRTCLQRAIDEKTDSFRIRELNEKKKYNSKQYINAEYSNHLLCFFIKLLTLDEVFLDRNYFTEEVEKTYNNCLVPKHLLGTVISLVKTCCGKFQMHKLSLFGYLFPSIIVAILENSPYLTELEVSRKNVTIDVMISIGNSCPNLIKLKLHNIGFFGNDENFDDNSISVEVFVKAFFGNKSLKFIERSIAEKVDVPVSFPHLKEFESGTKINGIRRRLSFAFFYYYANKYSLTCLNPYLNRKEMTESILYPLTKQENISLNLKELCLSYNFLLTQNLCNLQFFVNSIPKIEGLLLAINGWELDRQKIRATKNKLNVLLPQLKLVNTLALESNELSLDSIKRTFLAPVLSSAFGTGLVRLYLLFGDSWQSSSLLTILKEIFKSCSKLKFLILIIKNKMEVDYKLLNDGKFLIPKNNCLMKLWFWETCPTSRINQEEAKSFTRKWLMLLDIIQQSSPDLIFLSTTASVLGDFFVDNLSSNVPTFHLNNATNTCWESNQQVEISSNNIIRMVERFPYLRFLYLENLKNITFKKVREHFTNSDLQIYYGGINGWPYN